MMTTRMTTNKKENLHQRKSFGAVFERGSCMKKAISLVLILFIFCSLALTVNAEEFNGADLFTIDLPDGFEQSEEREGFFSFINENEDTFSISYSDNTVEGEVFSPEDMSEKDAEEYLKKLSEDAHIAMKEYSDKFEMKMYGEKVIKHKSKKAALVFQTKSKMAVEGQDFVNYQTIYEFGGINYKYTFTYTTADEKRLDSLNEVFDSINIFEGETQSKADKLSSYAAAAFLALLVFAGIVRFIRTPEKREKGKLK